MPVCRQILFTGLTLCRFYFFELFLNSEYIHNSKHVLYRHETISSKNRKILSYRRGFRLSQRSHLRTLKNFVSEKSGKRCEKLGKYWTKSGNREILRRFIFFPVSVPVFHSYSCSNCFIFILSTIVKDENICDDMISLYIYNN